MPTNSTPIAVNNANPTGGTLHAVVHPRQVGDEFKVLDDGQYFIPCSSMRAQPKMCTVTYLDHPSWNSKVQLFIYDNKCNLICENTQVPRDYLAAQWGWGMSSHLPMYLVLDIARDWQPGHNDGVKLNYGNNHFKPFVKPVVKDKTTSDYIGKYTYFKAAFPWK
ncbi:hypothetical protein IFR05_003223 [Cadophora sp. M221]|nr:hypothetical protein IFR05_003223 [Cadophora sp. M221]